MSAAGLRRRKAVEIVMFSLTGLCAAVALGALFAILGYIAAKGAAALDWDFLTKLPKPVGEEGGGIANAIVGTAKLVGLAMAIAVPVGVLAAVYLSEYAGKGFAFLVRYAADVLNGMPSIVMGIFAYTLIVLPMRRFSAAAGAVALAFILIPMVLRSSEEFIRLVPGSIREAALALGVPRWRMVLFVVLPTARRGIITGALLGMSRIAGETAPLIFTAFGNKFWAEGILQPIAALPLLIFNYAISPYQDWHEQAWAAAFLLLAFVLAVNVAVRLVLKPQGASPS